ncbi:MAG: flagellar M-ring protein FliF [Calditrichaeota bacterium]|nr:flagellar M-ring protein FliF [Calditrichota bacterium]HQU72485.1 flagellar basal-body MS-ring/collar protein FliF [Calditrichia bacterium]
MNGMFQQIQQQFLQFPLRQRMVIIGAFIGLVSAITALVLWANRPEYEMLYTNLDPGTASAVVEELATNSVKYRLENGGTTIYVPRENVADMRLKMAQNDLLKDGITGYELFEKNTMGMTTFMQRLNLRRALEGELVRTINQFPEVSQSRVHLVIPENRLFEKDRKGSASVVLHLKGGTSLSANQVSGIAALVANSAEGLTEDNVVIVDSRGNVLHDQNKNQNGIAAAGDQWQLQSRIESEYQTKVEDLLEGILGPSNAVVKVAVDLNFDLLERSIEEYDPDNTVVLSEETYTETSGQTEQEGDFKAEKTTSNYELSKKLERFVANPGNVNRLSVAVLVNGRYQESEGADGEAIRTYLPLTQDELDRIQSLVQNTVGFSDQRGDNVVVQNMEFNSEMALADQKFMQEMIERENLERYITYGLIALSILLVFFLLRGLLKSSTSLTLPIGQIAQTLGPRGEPLAMGAGGQAAGLPSGEGGARGLASGEDEDETLELEDLDAAEINEDIYIKKLSPEARARLRAKDKMTRRVLKFTEESPEDASRLLRSWMAQEHKKG